MENNILFRCSSLHYLMTDSRSKSEKISETTKTHLIDCFVSWKYGRKEEASGKALDKGNAREEDAITLLSRAKKVFYTKNSERLTNDYISGEPDLFEGESIRKADHTIDIKCSWSAHTFFRSKYKELEKAYYWQGIGYMMLTGASRHTVAFCLINSTDRIINDEKKRLAWQMGIIDGSSDLNYIEKCKQIERNHIFDMEAFQKEYPYFQFDTVVSDWAFDIPMASRLHTISFDRNQEDIERLIARIKDCREWLDNL